ncbi:LexA family protein [Modicisalibacter coralii]|uniref:LexA family protein n=1 Tax=Modicisalibacter coralii TaxID=2304602 RepID=UPI00100A7F7C|nr:translesion error-prone DNA polymerase V autoproteolytic subunit [Halomonas coralii]
MIHLDVIGRVDETAVPRLLPLAADAVRAGFPSPADDYIETELDLVEHLVQHPSSTFYVRAKGDSMVRDGIYDGDLLIVDRSLEPRDGDVLVIAVDGELTCKRLGTIGNRPYLIPGNPNYQAIPLTGSECHYWGVVTHNVHALRRGVGR